MAPILPDRDHTAETPEPSDRTVRLASYTAALAVVERLLAASPTLPDTVWIDCHEWAPDVVRVELNFHLSPDGVREFAEMVGSEATTRPHTNAPDSPEYTEASGVLDGIPWHAWTLAMDGGAK